MGYFVHSFTDTNSARINDCQEQVKSLQEKLQKSEDKLFELQNQLLITNGIIKQIPAQIDSIARANTEKQAKKIIKNPWKNW